MTLIQRMVRYPRTLIRAIRAIRGEKPLHRRRKVVMKRIRHWIQLLLAVGWVLTTANAQIPRHVASEGATITATVDAAGTEPFTYQWRKSGVPIPGTTARSLVLRPALPTHSGTYDVVVSNEFGSTTAPPVELTILPRGLSSTGDLRLTAPPAGQAVALGGTASFTVVAVSELGLPLAYQWRREGLNLPGATGSTLTLRNVTTEDFGRYSVLVSTTLGTVLSESVRLRLLGDNPLPPAIVSQPRAVALQPGGTLALTVGATPEDSLSYQWYRDGEELKGATTATLLETNAAAGSYTVVVSNSADRIESNPARVTVTSGEARLVNLSTRGPVGGDAGSLLAGFVLAGSGDRPVLLRGIGPALTAHGVGDALSDPKINVLDAGGRVLLANENWNDHAAAGLEVQTASAQAGAFPLPAGSADAALLAKLPAGTFTLEVGGAPGATGVALAEVYDAEPDPDPSRRLVNLSARGWVGAGGLPLVAGLVVAGTAARSVLVRAVGPGLAGHGIEDGLRRPALQVFDSDQTILASNSAWEAEGNGDALRDAMARVGAFTLTRGSADACVALTLPPGAYTAQVSSLDGVAGRVLLEVYELP